MNFLTVTITLVASSAGYNVVTYLIVLWKSFWKWIIKATAKPFQTDTAFNILQLNDIRGIEKLIIEEVNARHILVKTSEIIDDAQAEDKIRQLRKRIVNGESFADIAKEESGRSWFSRIKWQPGTGQAQIDTYQHLKNCLMNSLSTYSVQPIKTQFGWHIVEVLGRRNVDQTLQNNRQEARVDLMNRKAQEQNELWLNQLRTSAFIDIRDSKIGQ